jgi:phosphoribosylformylglycinamidine synthase
MLDKVPVREAGMTPYEIMLSESQERMLLVLKPEARERARAIFDKWELDFAEIGRLTDTGRLVLTMHGALAADMPVEPLVSQAPVYERPTTPTPKRPDVDLASLPRVRPAEALRKLVGCPDLASKRWVWEQYDHLIMGNTVQRPGGDAAVVRIGDGPKGLALSADCTPRYCAADPKRGGMQAVAENWRNLTAVGATPIALTDNMNFGNPERPEIMGQFAGCIEGMREACLALDYPVVSGNVSLYNETNGKGILPTPAIGGVGLLADVRRSVGIALRRDGDVLVLIGETKGHLGQSLYLREVCGKEEGPPPEVDLAAERRHGDFLRKLIGEGLVSSCHDLSDGGLSVALAEMAMAGRRGAALELAGGETPNAAWLFGEDQGRYLLAASAQNAPALLERARAAGVPAAAIGRVGGASLTLAPGEAISVAELIEINESWLPRYMAAGGPA